MKPLAAALAAALTGFAVMSLELAAVRLFAPHFGDSAYVWTNVIGVMLVALAAGAAIGGRLADPERCPVRLRNLLLIAGAITALVPLVAGPLGAGLLPADLPLDRATGALVRGSLVATLVAFAPPVLLAGTATPMLVAGLAHDGVRVGRASALVATWGTLGSLAGTFATTHVLVPDLGSRATVWICSGLLIASSLAVWPGRQAVVLLVPVACALVPLGPRRAPQPPAELLAEVESRYQFLQVVRDPGRDGEPAVTSLKINEGLDSFHSVRIEGTPWTDGRYYDWHAAIPLIAGDGKAPDHLRVLSLGAAAGTFERIFGYAFPGCHVDSVEIDPEVTRLGREYFGAFEHGERVFDGLDARVFVDHADSTWHVVLVDAYERQVYVPAHVASVEFFGAVMERLAPGGIVSVNAGGRNFDDPVVRVLASTLAEVFGEAWAFRVPNSRNFVIAARKEAPFDPEVLAELEVPDPTLAVIVARMATPESWFRVEREPGALVLVDDRPFLDQVQDEALARELDEPQLTLVDGTRDVAAVEADAFESAAGGAWENVVAVARTAERATGYLRLLVGDARWRLHDVAGSLAEYEEAERLGVEPAIVDPLRQRITDARAELAAAGRARDVATRNGWLVAAGGLWTVLVAAVALRFAAR